MDNAELYKLCQILTDELNRKGSLDEERISTLIGNEYPKVVQILVDYKLIKNACGCSDVFLLTNEASRYTILKRFDEMAENAKHQKWERRKANCSFWLSILSMLLSLISVSPLREWLLRLIEKSIASF